jgi:hypothetical protein
MFFSEVEGKRNGFMDEKGFCKEGFVLKIVSNKKDKNKPSEGLLCCMKV